jgi:hypothetical protein
MTFMQQLVLDQIIEELAQEECAHHNRSVADQLRLWLTDTDTLRHATLLIRTRYRVRTSAPPALSLLDRLRQRVR